MLGLLFWDTLEKVKNIFILDCGILNVVDTESSVLSLLLTITAKMEHNLTPMAESSLCPGLAIQ